MLKRNQARHLGLAALLGTVLFVSLAWSAEQPQVKAENIPALTTAARNGDISATRLLGDIYRDGVVVQKNLTTAFNYYADAARAGDGQARFQLGKAYHMGQGTESNQISAWIWLTLAGEEDATVKAEAMELRDKVSQTLTPAQQERAQILADSFREIFK